MEPCPNSNKKSNLFHIVAMLQITNLSVPPSVEIRANQQRTPLTCKKTKIAACIEPSSDHMKHTHLVREDHPLFSRRRVSSAQGMSSTSSAISSSSTFKNSEKRNENVLFKGTSAHKCECI